MDGEISELMVIGRDKGDGIVDRFAASDEPRAGTCTPLTASFFAFGSDGLLVDEAAECSEGLPVLDRLASRLACGP